MAEAPCWTASERGWHVSDDGVLCWHDGDGWSIADIAVWGHQGSPDEDAAYAALAATVARAEAAEADGRALREQLDKRDEELAAALVVIAAARMTTEDFAVITKTYTGREVAAVYRSVLEAATADPTPDPETDPEPCGLYLGEYGNCELPRWHDGDCAGASPVGVPVGDDTPRCGPTVHGFDCVLPYGHNQGRADVPENHAAVGDDTPVPTAGWTVDRTLPAHLPRFPLWNGKAVIAGDVLTVEQEKALTDLLNRAGAAPDLTAQQVQAWLTDHRDEMLAVLRRRDPDGIYSFEEALDAAVAALVRDTPEQAHDG